MTAGVPSHQPVDPFDLPEALGTSEVVWRATGGLSGCHLRGILEPVDGDPVPCDLLAVDDACTGPVADEATRLLVHRAWRDGQVLIVRRDDRLTVLVPGTGFSAEQVLEVLARFARSLGAAPSSYSVLLRLG